MIDRRHDNHDLAARGPAANCSRGQRPTRVEPGSRPLSAGSTQSVDSTGLDSSRLVSSPSLLTRPDRLVEQTKRGTSWTSARAHQETTQSIIGKRAKTKTTSPSKVPKSTFWPKLSQLLSSARRPFGCAASRARGRRRQLGAK